MVRRKFHSLDSIRQRARPLAADPPRVGSLAGAARHQGYGAVCALCAVRPELLVAQPRGPARGAGGDGEAAPRSRATSVLTGRNCLRRVVLVTENDKS